MMPALFSILALLFGPSVVVLIHMLIQHLRSRKERTEMDLFLSLIEATLYEHRADWEVGKYEAENKKLGVKMWIANGARSVKFELPLGKRIEADAIPHEVRERIWDAFQNPQDAVLCRSVQAVLDAGVAEYRTA